MSQQLQITGGAKVRSLEGVITGSTGVLGSLPINASNGIPQLDVNGKILVSQLPNSVMEYKGTWNAATNTPTLADGTGNQGDVYLCNVAGTVNFGSGPISFVVGDQVIYSGTIWQKASGATGTVTSVAVTESGDALSITGSPITTSGTINIGFAGSSAQYVAGDGSLITFPTVVTQAQNLVTEVYNQTGATLTKGTVVYINGGHGNLPTITKAIATSDSTSAQTYGVVRTNITNNNNGYVTVIGNLDNLDTQAYAAGTQLYLSSTTAGAWTSTKQYAPNHLVYVGIVVRSHPTQGVVEIRIQNGYEMDELHNVAAQSPSNGDILQYVTSTNLWTKTAGTTTNIAEGTNLYFTDARARTALSATTPLSYNNTTGAFSISQASGSADGYLSSTDWNTFNSKQDALTNPITGTGVSGRIPYFNGTTTQTSSANLTWDNTNSILSTTTVLATTDVAAYNLTLNGIDFGKIQNITGQSWGLAYASSGASNALGSSALVWNTTGNVIIINKLNVGNYNNTYNLDITGTARISGQLSLGSTITNATYTYTLPGATGTLALTSDLSSYLPLSGGTLTGALSGTSASFSSSVTALNLNAVSTNPYLILNDTSGTAAGAITFQNNGTQKWNLATQGTSNDLGLYNNGGTNSFNLYIKHSNGNVGIGTSSPIALLNIYGSTHLQLQNATTGSASSDGTRIQLSGNDLQIINREAADIISYTSDTERMRITSGGNVGIGTSSPNNKLEIINGVLGVSTNQTGEGILYGRIAMYSTGAGNAYINYGGEIRSYSGAGIDQSDLRFYTSPNAGATERMRITSAGNVGIGTTTPSSTLSLGTTVGKKLLVYDNPTAGVYTGLGQDLAAGNSTDLFAHGVSNLGFLTFGKIASNGTTYTEWMRINTSGNVGIGTTSPTEKLSINGSIAITGTDSTIRTSVNSSLAMELNNATANDFQLKAGGPFRVVNQAYNAVLLGISNTGAASFSGGISAGTLYLGSLGTGTVYSSSGTLTNTNPSDKRLKDNITPITYGLNEVLQLNPVSFDWKNDNNKNKQFGFIAQEVQEVMPEAVIDGEYLGLEKDAIYTALVNAIKELKKEIDELKNK